MEKLIISTAESHHGYGYVHKMKQLERDHTLIQLVINDTEHYLEQVNITRMLLYYVNCLVLCQRLNEAGYWSLDNRLIMDHG